MRNELSNKIRRDRELGFTYKQEVCHAQDSAQCAHASDVVGVGAPHAIEGVLVTAVLDGSTRPVPLEDPIVAPPALRRASTTCLPTAVLNVEPRHWSNSSHLYPKN